MIIFMFYHPSEVECKEHCSLTDDNNSNSAQKLTTQPIHEDIIPGAESAHVLNNFEVVSISGNMDQEGHHSEIDFSTPVKSKDKECSTSSDILNTAIEMTPHAEIPIKIEYIASIIEPVQSAPCSNEIDSFVESPNSISPLEIEENNSKELDMKHIEVVIYNKFVILILILFIPFLCCFRRKMDILKS